MKVSKIEKILELINRVHTIQKDVKVFLHTEFTDSLIWKDIDLWTELYRNMCKKKIKDNNRPKGGNILNIFNNVQKMLTNNKDDEKIEIVC